MAKLRQMLEAERIKERRETRGTTGRAPSRPDHHDEDGSNRRLDDSLPPKPQQQQQQSDAPHPQRHNRHALPRKSSLKAPGGAGGRAPPPPLNDEAGYNYNDNGNDNDDAPPTGRFSVKDGENTERLPDEVLSSTEVKIKINANPPPPSYPSITLTLYEFKSLLRPKSCPKRNGRAAKAASRVVCAATGTWLLLWSSNGSSSSSK